MAVELLETLDKLVKLHQGLLTVTKQKTIAIKDADTNDLQKQLKQEQTYISAINTVEQQRIQQTIKLLEDADRPASNPTLNDCIEVLTAPAEKEALEQKKVELILVIAELTQQNELNKELTYQSLQFVNMTMEMIMPKKNTMNYSNQKGIPNQSRPNRSMFDSRT